jgi:predicted glutamine amidotransferase
MSRLFGFMCNDPERIACALYPARESLVVTGAPDGWGLAFFQGGEVLLQRHPKPVGSVDFYAQTRDLRTDYLVGQVREPGTPSKLENTQPYRFRSWVYAQSGVLPRPAEPGAAPEKLQQGILEHVPDFLRRNIRGQNDAELLFHVFLSFLHDGGKIDDPNIRVAEAASALRATVALVERFLGGNRLEVNAVATNGRIMIGLRNGAAMWLRQVSGINDCKVCRETNPEAARGERRRTTHEHLRAILMVSEPEKISPDGWEEVAVGSIVGISRDLGKSIHSLRA